jgi:DNA polymerase V
MIYTIIVFYMSLEVKTKTTGFGSPAESYVQKRLDLNDLIISDTFTTYFFKWEGPVFNQVKTGDVLVVDKAQTPEEGDLILVEKEGKISLDIFTAQIKEIWGTITWTLSQQKK